MFDIITIGSATRDVFIRSKDLMIVRSRAFKTGVAECIGLGSKTEVSEIYYTVGGSAANTAVAFSRQGFRSACVARVGDDVRGKEIEKSLRKDKVTTRFLQYDKKQMTAYSMILLAPSGERSILIYRGALEDLDARHIPWNAFSAQWCYITHLAGKSAALFPKLIQFASQHNIKIAVNPGATQLRMSPRTLKPLLKKIDVFILNREEASYLTHRSYGKPEAIFAQLDMWVRGLVVMTDGPRGVTVSDGKTRWHAGILREKGVVDRTGAGDAFGSGFVTGLMRKKDIPYAIRLGSANATSVIEKVGAQPGILRKGDSISRWGFLRVTHKKIA